MTATLPVRMDLSWLPPALLASSESPEREQQQSSATASAAETITCPLTGGQIHKCCCPLED